MKDGLCKPANNWGLPDWRDIAAYGLTSGWTKHRWRWEFYRRREDLRAYFDHWCNPSDEYLVGHGKRPEGEGFCHSEARSNFGYSPLPNPRVGDHNKHLLWPHVGTGLGNQISGSNLEDRRIGPLLEQVGVILDGKQAFMLREILTYRYAPLAENQTILTFDLDKPLEAQLGQAKEVLSDHQKQRNGKSVQRRQSPGKWLTYLRVLDGRECGASWSEIATILIVTAQTEQSARDVWEQARALCFNFPY
jgi:hypothetical protein